MKTLLALFVLLALGISASAAEIRKGATTHVKPNAIWFQDAEKLARWQALKKGGDATVLAAYEKEVLGAREAWQFLKTLSVKVLGVDRVKQQVNVEMKTKGRMEGTAWFLDQAALAR